MISVVIPTLNAGERLPRTLGALVPAAIDGLIKEVIVADGGSADRTLAVADDAGCVVVGAKRGRGGQLAAGAAVARADWLLFLHADTVLQAGWEEHAKAHMTRGTDEAATFRFRLDERGLAARYVEAVVAARCALLALPYGDQGLLISRRLYEKVGGFADIPLMEDVDLVRRLGRRRLAYLPAAATTSAERYRREGYVARMARNATCIGLYFLGVAPQRIARIYR
jgi:rSAM/selenodomain-associated transferase 2